MSRTIGCLRAAALALAMGGAFCGPSIARADPQRVPLAGTPALVVDAPQGWKVYRNETGSILILTGGEPFAGLLEVTMIADPVLATKTDADMAATFFKGLDPPATYDRTERVSIGGAPAQAFMGDAMPKSGRVFAVKVIIVRLGATLASMITQTAPKEMTPTQTAVLDGIVAHISLIR